MLPTFQSADSRVGSYSQNDKDEKIDIHAMLSGLPPNLSFPEN